MKNRSVEILQTGFLAGTLDIISAFIYFVLKTGNKDVSAVLKYIASGLFGKKAFSGGPEMIAAGLLLHFFIAGIFSVLFYLIFRRLRLVLRNTIFIGILYGIFVWAVMNFVIVPFSNVLKRPFNITASIINLTILIICVGIPLAFRAKNFYAKESTS